jgi:hypothetical protein
MKSVILSLILLFIFGSMIEIQAQTTPPSTITVKHQKTVTKENLTIKFVSVVEDSRCPVGVNCIWAGNAKVQIKISNKKGISQTFELNTDLQPQIAAFDGFEIKLQNLTPHPKAETTTSPNSYTAVFAICKL